MIDLNLEKGAVFSNCLNYRFLLWRCWDKKLPKVLFIGLNPSVADDVKDDATTKKLISFAKLNGYGGLVLGNCFPFIATNPKNLNDYSFLRQNDNWLKSIRPNLSEVVFAWGNFSTVYENKRDVDMQKLFPSARIISKNKNGSPKHPLYAKFGTITENYSSIRKKEFAKTYV
ncbi:DUF1643 domain-containing protein [Muricauda sp. DJ-13]|uniref:DUF1643 domain-containing protein n=1 Tax=Croceivirga thetidis TaxID=2721623 RepID=A0ABX1GSH6_9FLAO|nr:DUF1643 domain-containing protein [Croceivirga thetidis]